MTAAVVHGAARGRARRGLPPVAVGAVVLCGQAMASLDTAIVNVGAPQIQQDLHLSGAALQAALFGYVLVYAVGMVTGARLGTRWGPGRTFVWGIAVFTTASLACGLALDPAMLIAARAVQGAGAALLVPQVLSLLQSTFQGEARRRSLALYATVLAVGVALGQVLGGALVSADLFGSGWRPIFLVNLPVGVAVLLVAARRMPAEAARAHAALDVAGAGLLAASVLALVLPLTFGAGAGWPWWCWPVLAAGPAGLAAFHRYERRLAAVGGRPLVHPDLLGRRDVRLGLAGAFVLMACYGGLLFTIALHLQYDLHDSALRSGLTFAFYAFGFAAASQTWPRLPASWHPHLPGAALALFAGATAVLAWTCQGGRWPWPADALLVLAGAGHGSGFGALVRRMVERAPAEHAASIGGVLSTVTQLAVVTGIAALGTLYLAVPSMGTALPALTLVLLVCAAATAVTGAALHVLGTRPAGAEVTRR